MAIFSESDFIKGTRYQSDVNSDMEAIKESSDIHQEQIDDKTSWLKAFGAAVQLYYPITNSADEQRMHALDVLERPKDERDNLTSDPIQKAAELGFEGDDLNSFIFVDSDREFEHMVQLKKRDQQYMQQASTSISAQLAAGLTDPTNFIPAIRALKTAGTAAKIGTGALNVGLAAGISELSLQSTRASITDEESITNVAMASLFGAAFGLGSAAVDARQIKQFNDFKSAVLHPQVGSLSDEIAVDTSVGAMKVRSQAPEGEELAGNMFSNAYLKITRKLSPATNLFQSKLDFIKRDAGKLISNSFYKKNNYTDDLSKVIGDEVSAEDAILTSQLQHITPFVKDYTDSYKNFSKENFSFKERLLSGTRLRKNFDVEVIKTITSGTEHNNAHVNIAARSVTKNVYEPLLNQAIKAGLIPEGTTIKNAAAYFPQLWDIPTLMKHGSWFIDNRLKPWLRTELADRTNMKGATADELDTYVDMVAIDMYNHIVTTKGNPDWAKYVQGVQGRLKGRVINIPQSLLIDQKVMGESISFLKTDLVNVTGNVQRKMSGDIALQERFGTTRWEDLDLQYLKEFNDTLDKIRTKYKGDETLQNKKVKEATEEFNSAMDDMREMWVQLKGTAVSSSGIHAVDELLHGLKRLTYFASMGGVLIGSIGDPVLQMMRHGVYRVSKSYAARLRGAVMEALGDVKTIQQNKEFLRDIERYGISGDVALQTRLASLQGLDDGLSVGSSANRFLMSLEPEFNKYTAIAHFNDFNSTRSAVTAQLLIDDVTKAALNGEKLSKVDVANISQLGVDPSKFKAIAEQIAKHGGETLNGVKTFNLHRWDNQALAETVANAVRKNSYQSVLRKGIGDTPKWTNTWWGKIFGQFLNFSFAINNKVLVPGMQRMDARFLYTVVSMTLMGVLVDMLKDIVAGREPEKDIEKLIYNGVDRSGIIAVPMMVNMYSRLLTGVGYDPNKDRDKSRLQLQQDAIRTLGAPVGTLMKISEAMAGLWDGDWSDADIHAWRKIMIAQNHPLFSMFYDLAEEGISEATGARHKGERKQKGN